MSDRRTSGRVSRGGARPGKEPSEGGPTDEPEDDLQTREKPSRGKNLRVVDKRESTRVAAGSAVSDGPEDGPADESDPDADDGPSDGDATHAG